MSVASRARCELIRTSDLGLTILREGNAYSRKQVITAVRRRPGRKSNKLVWVLAAAILLFCAEITFIAGYLHAKASNIPVIVQQPPQLVLREARLGLRVDVQPNGLRVSWTPETSAVQSASEASLQIDEGLQHRDIHLGPAQIAGGSILYRPTSDDVTFRLELRPAGNATVAQTVRVVGGSRAQADTDTGAKPSSRKRNFAKPPQTHSWHWLESATTAIRPKAVTPIPALQRPPDIRVESVPNPKSLPFTPSGPPPPYSPPDRRSKFFTSTIKHFGSILKDARKKGTSEAFMPSR